MPHNTTRFAKFPFSSKTMTSHTKKLTGSGMGSVLLSRGGPGVGSSYSDMDDYIRTTGINPYARVQQSTSKDGSGLKSLSSKLSKLKMESPSVGKPKMKNIRMSL